MDYQFEELLLLEKIDYIITEYTKGKTPLKYTFKRTNEAKNGNTTEYLYTWQYVGKRDGKSVSKWKCWGNAMKNPEIIASHYHPEAVKYLSSAILLLEKRMNLVKKELAGIDFDNLTAKEQDTMIQAIYDKLAVKHTKIFTAEDLIEKAENMIQHDTRKRELIGLFTPKN